MAFQIISDGSCDLGTERAARENVTVVPFYVSFDDVTYKKEIEEVPVREFYQEMVDRADCFPKSSLPPVQDYLNVFRKYAAEGKDIICICITTKFSGSYNSAMNAKEILLEEYPDTKIEVIDSTVNTVLQGLLVLEICRMQQAGWSFEETVKRTRELMPTGRIIFTVGSFDYLVHGGRIGKVMGAMVKSLNIKPLIILRDGEIFPAGVFRNREKGKKTLIELCRKHFEKEGLDPDQYVFNIGYGYDYEEAVAFREMLLDSLKEYSHITDMELFQIGAAIGVHTGPYPIGISFIEKAF